MKKDEPAGKQTGDALCPTCSGKGRIDGKICKDCEGTGTIRAIVGDA